MGSAGGVQQRGARPPGSPGDGPEGRAWTHGDPPGTRRADGKGESGASEFIFQCHSHSHGQGVLFFPDNCSLVQDGPPTRSTDSSSHSGSAVLPLTLGLITFLPALRSIQAPGLIILRSFFEDLRPQHRHVSTTHPKGFTLVTSD